MLNEWFLALTPMMRMYWGVAIFASVIFVIQMVMSFIGVGDVDSMGGDADVDFSTDADSLDDAGAMHLLSIRNIIYFLLGFGWAGVSLCHSIENGILLCVTAVAVGCLFVAIFIFLFRQMMRLQTNGAYDINDAVGKVCDVYMRIPASQQGLGKVQISFNGSVQEIAAATEGEDIPSGNKVRVLRVIDGTSLLVEKA